MMAKKIKMMAMMFCVAALATLSSCSKESELIGTKWKCTYNASTYTYDENQYVGTEWEFSDKEENDVLDTYYLYINGVQVASYKINSAADPNFYEIVDMCNLEPTAYLLIAEGLMGHELSIKGNTMECVDYEGKPLVTWSKL